jgi:hypothetical protein
MLSSVFHTWFSMFKINFIMWKYISTITLLQFMNSEKRKNELCSFFSLREWKTLCVFHLLNQWWNGCSNSLKGMWWCVVLHWVLDVQNKFHCVFYEFNTSPFTIYNHWEPMVNFVKGDVVMCCFTLGSRCSIIFSLCENIIQHIPFYEMENTLYSIILSFSYLVFTMCYGSQNHIKGISYVTIYLIFCKRRNE